MARGTTPKKIEIQQRRQQVAELYLSGKTQVEIGEGLGVNQATISRDLKALREAWQESALVALDTAKARELARIDHLERTYWRAWERSLEDKEVETKKAATGNAGQRSEALVRREGQTGDPRFLGGVQWCIQQRCKVLGIEAASKIDLGVFDLDKWMQQREQRLAAVEGIEEPKD